MKKYISKKFIIISGIIGFIAPFLLFLGLADGSPIPGFVSYVLWIIPGSIAALILSGGVFNSLLGGYSILVFLVVSVIYYIIILSLIRAIIIAIRK